MGVYGDHAGAWVDEDTALTPPAPRAGVPALPAEAAWQTMAPARLHILRLAGIYGPRSRPVHQAETRHGRNASSNPDRCFRASTATTSAQRFWACLQSERAGAIYNLCDDEPAPPQDVITYAAELAGHRTAARGSIRQGRSVTHGRAGFYSESKRVHNDRIKT